MVQYILPGNDVLINKDINSRHIKEYSIIWDILDLWPKKLSYFMNPDKPIFRDIVKISQCIRLVWEDTHSLR